MLKWAPLKSSFTPKKYKATIILILLVVLVFTIFPLLNKKELYQAQKILNSLSIEERKQIEWLFRNLFVQNELGYTLFGDKPMSICWPNTLSPRFSNSNCTFKLYVEGTIPLYKALDVWKKIKQEIQTDNYSLIICEENQYPSFTILINKHAFVEQFNRNIDLFRRYYTKDITADAIIASLQQKNDKSILADRLFRNDILLGIMLGFGRHSAELFQRRLDLSSEDAEPPFLQHKIPSKGFCSIAEELQYLTQHLQTQSKTCEWYTNTFPLLLRVTTVAFAFDPDDPEAQLLISKYKILHTKLTKIFDRSDWLEVVVTQLMSNQRVNA